MKETDGRFPSRILVEKKDVVSRELIEVKISLFFVNIRL